MRHLRSARHRRLIDLLVEARQASGLSQRMLAARLKRSPSYVSKFEAGERRLEVCEFVDFCAAINADAAELVRRLARDTRTVV
jgi:ribosome-binding protein aMBF1 (putative translation factor)